MVENNEKVASETATQNSDAGNKPAEPDKIERAELAVKRMEESEKRLDEKIAKLQELEVNRLLGSTAGGHIESMMTPEQHAQAEAKRRADEIVKAFK
ncbi:MAG: hypothetical protein WC499_04345 [Patescibacteria group bacterium]